MKYEVCKNPMNDSRGRWLVRKVRADGRTQFENQCPDFRTRKEAQADCDSRNLWIATPCDMPGAEYRALRR